MGIFQENDFVMLTADDFLKYRSSSSFITVATKGDVGDDTFFFEESTKVLTAQSSNTMQGGFNFYFPNVHIGDVIEVECEMRSISGNLPQLYFDEVSAIDGTGTHANSTYKEISQQGQWEAIDQSFIVRNTTYNNTVVFIGLTTANTGRFQLRNLKVRLKRSIFNRKQEVSRKYCITKFNGTWVYDQYTSSDIPTISLADGNVKVTFDISFAKRAIALITINNSVSLPYKVTVDAQYGYLTVAFYDDTNTKVDASIIPNNTKFYLHVLGEL